MTRWQSRKVSRYRTVEKCDVLKGKQIQIKHLNLMNLCCIGNIGIVADMQAMLYNVWRHYTIFDILRRCLNNIFLCIGSAFKHFALRVLYNIIKYRQTLFACLHCIAIDPQFLILNWIYLLLCFQAPSAEPGRGPRVGVWRLRRFVRKFPLQMVTANKIFKLPQLCLRWRRQLGWQTWGVAESEGEQWTIAIVTLLKINHLLDILGFLHPMGKTSYYNSSWFTMLSTLSEQSCIRMLLWLKWHYLLLVPYK